MIRKKLFQTTVALMCLVLCSCSDNKVEVYTVPIACGEHEEYPLICAVEFADGNETVLPPTGEYAFISKSGSRAVVNFYYEYEPFDFFVHARPLISDMEADTFSPYPAEELPHIDDRYANCLFNFVRINRGIYSVDVLLDNFVISIRAIDEVNYDGEKISLRTLGGSNPRELTLTEVADLLNQIPIHQFIPEYREKEIQK